MGKVPLIRSMKKKENKRVVDGFLLAIEVLAVFGSGFCAF